MKKKSIITSIIVAIVGIAAVIGILLFMSNSHESGEYNPLNTEKFELKITWKDNEVLYDEEVKFTEGETLYHILDRKFGEDMVIQNDYGYIGILGFKLDGVSYIADWNVDYSYLSLMVNNEYAIQGATDLVVEKGMICEFVWTDMGAF